MNSDLVQHRSSADHALPSLSVFAKVAQRHTRAPWVAECIGVTDAGPNGQDVYEILSADGYARICEGITEANAARIVACVNYCDGMPTTDLVHTRLLTLLDTAATFQRERDALRASNAELVAALRRAEVLVNLLTVRQVIEGGDEAIDAAGLNPYCMNEGLAEGHERIGAYFIHAALARSAP